MADIRITSTGREFYQVSNETAAILTEAFPAAIEYVKKAEPTPKPAPEPTWGIGQKINETYYVQFVHPMFGSTLFDGPPEGLDGFSKSLPGRVQIPAEIRERYSGLYKGRKGGAL